MEIDPHNLPKDVAALQQLVIGLLSELDAKDRRLKQVQHWLEQVLRWRYGQKRERVDENQLFLFAAELVHAGKPAPRAETAEDGTAGPDVRSQVEAERPWPAGPAAIAGAAAHGL